MPRTSENTWKEQGRQTRSFARFFIDLISFERTEQAQAPRAHTRQLNPDLRCAILLVGDGGTRNKGQCGALVVKEHISSPRYRLRLLPVAALVVRRRYLIVVPRTMPAAPRRYLIVVPRPMPAAPQRYLIVVPMP